MKSGMLAAESACDLILNEKTQETVGLEPKDYADRIKESYVMKDLYEVRNSRPSFHTALGLYGGVAYSGFSIFLGGKEPWTLSHGGK